LTTYRIDNLSDYTSISSEIVKLLISTHLFWQQGRVHKSHTMKTVLCLQF